MVLSNNFYKHANAFISFMKKNKTRKLNASVYLNLNMTQI